MLNEEMLLGVRKPARYIGQEWNVSKKDFDSAIVKFGLAFPDLYEVAMSNLGIRILYSVLNKINYVVCERVFAVDIDMEQLLKDNNESIFSLESKKPLKEFDIIGFSLPYELCYTNILKMLSLGNIPLKSSERSNNDPLIIGGGPCTLNPEPLCDFFDLFFIGEADEGIVEIVECYKTLKEDYKKGNISREDLLIKMSRIEGVYVPALYNVEYNDDGTLKNFSSKNKDISAKVVKRIVQDLNKTNFPSEWIVPYIQVVHDRVCLEVMRGCPNRCRFCQARIQYFPLRNVKADKLIKDAFIAFEKTGYEEMSLLGLSVSDYPYLKDVLVPLIAEFKDKGISISLPSVKPKTILGNMSSLIATIKKTGLTFAPEAATDQLRNDLGKDFNNEEFFQVLEEAYKSGYQHLKLYFMIGIPKETLNDLEEIVKFALKSSQLKKIVAGRGNAFVNVSINTIIPKPHTAFQWFKMLSVEESNQKQEFIKSKVNNRNLKFSFHNSQMSFLEGVFSRGDRKLAGVILDAFNNGAKFDAWQEHFNIEKWMMAFKNCNIDPYFYLNEIADTQILPWDFIDTGVSKEFLLSEKNKIIAT